MVGRGTDFFVEIFFGNPIGLVVVSIALVIYGSQQEDKDVNNKSINKGWTSFSKVLYGLSIFTFIFAIILWKYL